MSFLDSSDALAHLLIEIRQSFGSLGEETLVSCRLPEYIRWTPPAVPTCTSLRRRGAPADWVCRDVGAVFGG